MRLIADLHIHSRYSGATSQRMNIPELVSFAELKGLDLLGTGDALHPSWMRELKEELEPLDNGFYRAKGGGKTLFVAQVEVATIHTFGGKSRRIHHVILMPSLEVAEQLSDVLKRHGDMEVDGRPVLTVEPAELVEEVMSIDQWNLVFPAHVWTPWWSVLGAIGGMDSIEECYQDQVKHIHAAETGLSSDPPMNWRVSWMDQYTLLSFSDSHSPYPFRLGREAVVFELPEPSYREIVDAVVKKDPARVRMTLEVPPEYGKYHWSGHRRCGVGPISPDEAGKMGYRCPVCGRRLTKGVDDRVEELADRPRGYKPENAIDYMHILPLQELIALDMGLGVESETRLNSKKVWREYEKLVAKLGNEFHILLNASEKEIEEVGGPGLARLITKMRRGQLKIIPGYDGVYGKLVLEEGKRSSGPTKLEDFL